MFVHIGTYFLYMIVISFGMNSLIGFVVTQLVSVNNTSVYISSLYIVWFM